VGNAGNRRAHSANVQTARLRQSNRESLLGKYTGLDLEAPSLRLIMCSLHFVNVWETYAER
jgi:hypothetical protein